jgi:hypothetical protein
MGVTASLSKRSSASFVTRQFLSLSSTGLYGARVVSMATLRTCIVPRSPIPNWRRRFPTPTIQLSAQISLTLSNPSSLMMLVMRWTRRKIVVIAKRIMLGTQRRQMF